MRAGLVIDKLRVDAAHCVDHAAELDQGTVAGALDHAPVICGDGGIDQIAP